jgi:hypothetical protein
VGTRESENFDKTVWEPLETVSDQWSSMVHFGGLNEVNFFSLQLFSMHFYNSAISVHLFATRKL